MTDIYKTPSSELTESAPLEGFGSLERGIGGQFQFSIREIVSEAWKKTSGAKGTIWLAMLLYIVVATPVSVGIPILLELIGLSSQPAPGEPYNAMVVLGFIVSQIIILSITLPLGAGLFMVGLKIAVGATVSSTEVFGHFHKTLPLLVSVILIYFMMLVGFALLILPGIYLLVAYYLAIPLIVEKNLSPWQAMEASRKAITKCWFRFFGLGILILLIAAVAMIPLGIGLIWVMPFIFIAYGIVYRNIFGFEGEVSA